MVTTMAGKYRLTTLGCKVNQYESEQVRRLLESAGYSPARRGERADVAVVNTCAVTCSATAKSRQTLRKLAKNANQTIAVGCYATAEPDRVAEICGVDRVIGHDEDALDEIQNLLRRRHPQSGQNRGSVAQPPYSSGSNIEAPGPAPSESGDQTSHFVPIGLHISGDATEIEPSERGSPPPDTNKNSIRTLGDEVNQAADNLATLSQLGAASEAVAYRDPMGHVCDNGAGRPLVSLPLAADAMTFASGLREFGGRTRAFLKIQDGCDASCTYCIIPKLRTALRSKPIADAVAEARSLVAGGHKEIVLTGIFLGAYGRETAIRKRFTNHSSPLAELVDALAGVEGLERLRLSSLEPGDMNDELMSVIAGHSNCVPHFHLPLQSGSGETLRKMNRQYTVPAFVDMIDRVNAAMDRPAITTDIIVGFPGETDAMFEETLAVARYAGFCKIHAFPFSPRPQTAAARWSKDFVHQQTVKDRMAVLGELEKELALAYAKKFIGETHRVLVEGRKLAEGSKNNDTPTATALAHGRTDRYFEVWFESRTAKPGDLTQVRIDRVTPTRIHGTQKNSP